MAISSLGLLGTRLGKGRCGETLQSHRPSILPEFNGLGEVLNSDFPPS